MIVCINCNYENESNSKYCQECGVSLREKRSSPDELEPPPPEGITIEFPYSTAQAFEFAVQSAKKISTFKQFREGKKAIYRVAFDRKGLGEADELLNHLKGWKKRTVYVDGERVLWNSVFSYRWCYERKKGCYRPELYCFGYEEKYSFNMWGCLHSGISFSENSGLFTWGDWLNNKGDWEFDKDRIKHELEDALFSYRFCPAINFHLVGNVISAIPDIVNPSKDKNWKFIESYDGGMTLAIKVETYGFRGKEKITVEGVAPKGKEGIKEIFRRVNVDVSEALSKMIPEYTLHANINYTENYEVDLQIPEKVKHLSKRCPRCGEKTNVSAQFCSCGYYYE